MTNNYSIQLKLYCYFFFTSLRANFERIRALFDGFPKSELSKVYKPFYLLRHKFRNCFSKSQVVAFKKLAIKKSMSVYYNAIFWNMYEMVELFQSVAQGLYFLWMQRVEIDNNLTLVLHL